eukprot:347906_1
MHARRHWNTRRAENDRSVPYSSRAHLYQELGRSSLKRNVSPSRSKCTAKKEPVKVENIPKIATKSTEFSVQLMANPRDCGGLIGYSGNTIKALRVDLGIDIKVFDQSPRLPRRSISLRGSLKRVISGAVGIVSKLDEIARMERKRHFPKASDVNTKLKAHVVIPPSLIENLTGKDGEIMRGMQFISGARFEVVDSEINNNAITLVEVYGFKEQLARGFDRMFSKMATDLGIVVDDDSQKGDDTMGNSSKDANIDAVTGPPPSTDGTQTPNMGDTPRWVSPRHFSDTSEDEASQDTSLRTSRKRQREDVPRSGGPEKKAKISSCSPGHSDHTPLAKACSSLGQQATTAVSKSPTKSRSQSLPRDVKRPRANDSHSGSSRHDQTNLSITPARKRYLDNLTGIPNSTKRRRTDSSIGVKAGSLSADRSRPGPQLSLLPRSTPAKNGSHVVHSSRTVQSDGRKYCPDTNLRMPRDRSPCRQPRSPCRLPRSPCRVSRSPCRLPRSLCRLSRSPPRKRKLTRRDRFNMLNREEQKRLSPMRCELCDVKYSSEYVKRQHLAGKRHRAALAKLEMDNADSATNSAQSSKQTGEQDSTSSRNMTPGNGVMSRKKPFGQARARKEQMKSPVNIPPRNSSNKSNSSGKVLNAFTKALRTTRHRMLMESQAVTRERDRLLEQVSSARNSCDVRSLRRFQIICEAWESKFTASRAALNKSLNNASRLAAQVDLKSVEIKKVSRQTCELRSQLRNLESCLERLARSATAQSTVKRESGVQHDRPKDIKNVLKSQRQEAREPNEPEYTLDRIFAERLNPQTAKREFLVRFVSEMVGLNVTGFRPKI